MQENEAPPQNAECEQVLSQCKELGCKCGCEGRDGCCKTTARHNMRQPRPGSATQKLKNKVDKMQKEHEEGCWEMLKLQCGKERKTCAGAPCKPGSTDECCNKKVKFLCFSKNDESDEEQTKQTKQKRDPESLYARHQCRMRRVAAKVDTRPPAFHVKTFLKKDVLVEWNHIHMRRQDENKSMVMRINKIMRTKGKVDHFYPGAGIQKSNIPDRWLNWANRVEKQNMKMQQLVDETVS